MNKATNINEKYDKIQETHRLFSLEEPELVKKKTFINDFLKCFNAEKDFGKYNAGINAETNKQILALQPVKNFKTLIHELLNLKCYIPRKNFVGIFKHVMSKIEKLK